MIPDPIPTVPYLRVVGSLYAPNSCEGRSAMSTALVETHDVIGEPEHIRAALASAEQSGRLISVFGTPSVLPDGRVHVRVELLTAEPARHVRYAPRTRPVRRRPDPLRTAVVALAAALVVTIVVGIVWMVVVWVLAHLAALIGGAVLLGLVLWALTRSGSGGHCPGCPR